MLQHKVSEVSWKSFELKRETIRINLSKSQPNRDLPSYAQGCEIIGKPFLPYKWKEIFI